MYITWHDFVNRTTAGDSANLQFNTVPVVGSWYTLELNNNNEHWIVESATIATTPPDDSRNSVPDNAEICEIRDAVGVVCSETPGCAFVSASFGECSCNRWKSLHIGDWISFSACYNGRPEFTGSAQHKVKRWRKIASLYPARRLRNTVVVTASISPRQQNVKSPTRPTECPTTVVLANDRSNWDKRTRVKEKSTQAACSASGAANTNAKVVKLNYNCIRYACVRVLCR
ncbi:unnamed protein product [Gongylonema pulchrum]|uniref:Eph LBD domain-containing protein n=1 Tax=Gongylonema pulchrum TaxID=637853 RepID=A0A183DSL7_9BILA|nr:unnamed protein product [Gongylonema pulchrum]